MADPFLGEIKMCAFPFAPKGWALCNGTVMQIQQNAALFSLLGVTFGGNGQTTFNLPDMRGRVPLHRVMNSPLYSSGHAGGAEAVAITTSTMPSHSHGFNAANVPADKPNPSNRVPAVASVSAYTPAANLVAMNAATITSNGSSGSEHSNTQPSTVVNFVIALVGTYPARN